MRPDWLSVPEARRTILDGVHPLGSEVRPLLDSLGYVLAEDLTSPVDLPPWNNSAMDGFAVRAVDVGGASETAPRELRVIEDVPAGGFPRRSVEPGTAIRVMTGAPVPEGADGVIRVEHTDGGVLSPDGTGRVRIINDADGGRNIRPRGEDLRRGARALSAGAELGPARIGIAASLGRRELRVTRRPTVAVLASGDELVDVGDFEEVLRGRRIVSSNSYTLAARLAESGIEARVLGIAADSPGSLREHLERAAGCDALITTAGISVGAHDYVRDVLAGMGLRPAFWRVRMRPGSPLGFGWIDRLGGVPWFGLPGNPVSCMVTFELFARPALLRMSGRTRIFAPTAPARLLDPYPQPSGLVHFPRVRLAQESDGTLGARLTGGQGSGVLTSMAAADGLMVVPAEPGGAEVGQVLPTVLLGASPLRDEPGY
jgi:molybdopterin molybdotransferase